MGECGLSRSSGLLGVQNAGSTAGKLIVCKRIGYNQHAKKGVSREGERGSGGLQDHTGGQGPGSLEDR